jgi:ferritin-like protein
MENILKKEKEDNKRININQSQTEDKLKSHFEIIEKGIKQLQNKKPVRMSYLYQVHKSCQE